MSTPQDPNQAGQQPQSPPPREGGPAVPPAQGAADEPGRYGTTEPPASEPPASPPYGAPAPPPFQNPGQPPKRSWIARHKVLTAVGGVVALLVVFGTIGAIVGPPPETTSSVAAPTSPSAAPVTTAAPTTAATTAAATTSAPTATPPKPTKPPTLDAQARTALDGANLNGLQVAAASGSLTVRWDISENLTKGLTKDTARLQGTEILKRVKPLTYSRVVLRGYYPLVDQLGNTSNGLVVNAVYSQSRMKAINFEGIDYKNVFELADVTSFVHPAFQY